ncbi:helix-turn-helix domain-containing protein [Haloglomus halophilum]|uniref:helix-turn-helix domain-containing protein n=1 Tax=Haloglomus halophilum TaxID=2962672 RepID=UPI0020CA1BB2|nr:helix-turn-helix domain-containing protein [Haloglomus halophilum]
MTVSEPGPETTAERVPVEVPDLETVLSAVFGLRASESSAYLGLLRVPDSSAAEVAEELGRDRSNVNRSLRTLRDRGFAERRRVLLEEGGHVYRYSPTPLPVVRERMHEALTEWTDGARDRIDDFGADIEPASQTEAEGAEGVYAGRNKD